MKRANSSEQVLISVSENAVRKTFGSVVTIVGDTKDVGSPDSDYSIDLGESDTNDVVTAPTEVANKDETRISRKRRRRRRRITICTANCRYEVVRRVAYRLGMNEVQDDDTWNLYWTDLSISVERCKDMKRFQKINHFPGMSEICRKDLLARNLNRMLKLYPEEYSFFPKTWCLPADMADVITYARAKRHKTYILKPDMGCQGRGIVITKTIRDFPVHEKMICQVYVTRPFLIDGYKFDFRVYTLITSCDPLRIFVYNDGLVRFATSRYREPTGGNSTNMYMHLTNYAVNKHSRMYVVDDELGSKRKISTLNRWFQEKNYDLRAIWEATDDVIIKTIIAAHPQLKHNYHTCFPTHDYTYACFEILGFDILLDENLKPYVLEVNHSPSFHTDSQIDRDVKERLLQDTFEILNLNNCDKRKVLEEDRRRIRERLLRGIFKEPGSEVEQGQSRSHLAVQTQWEEAHKGNFRKVYPCEDSEKYDKFFHQSTSSLFQDTAASRAREEASRVQREESLNKAKQEAARRAVARQSLEKLRSETKVKTASYLKLQEIQKSLSNSFEPLPIVEAEEMERLYQLKQREFLLRSYGLIDQIYVYLKKNRALRPEDELKYGPASSNFAPTEIQSLPSNEKQPGKYLGSLLPEQLTGTKTSLVLKMPKSRDGDGDLKKKSYQTPGVSLDGIDNKGLIVRSNEAPLSLRPALPGTKWPFLSSVPQPPLTLPALTNADVRSTKAQVARTYTNNAKLRQLERRQQRHVDQET